MNRGVNALGVGDCIRKEKSPQVMVVKSDLATSKLGI